MSTLWRPSLLLLPALLIAGDVETDFDPKIDFKAYKTYSFIKGIELTKTGILSDPKTRDRFRNFISGVLDTRGVREVPIDEPHGLSVRYWIAKKDKQDVTATTFGVGGGYYDPYFGGFPPYWDGAWGWSYTEYVVNNYVEGELIVDLIDTKTKELVWRTFLRQKIEDRMKAYEEAKKKLNKSLAGFPPSQDAIEKMTKERAKLEKKYAGQ